MQGTDIYSRIERLLDQERKILLEGDFSKIASVAEQKEALIESLAEADLGKDDRIADLRSKARRNERMLEHAKAGIESAEESLETLHQAYQTLETYDALGQRQAISPRIESSIERRA